MALVNRHTGQEATPEQLEACRHHAERILASPYSAPELVQWAIEVPGVDIDGWFWPSCSTDARRRRQESLAEVARGCPSTAQVPDGGR